MCIVYRVIYIYIYIHTYTYTHTIHITHTFWMYVSNRVATVAVATVRCLHETKQTNKSTTNNNVS